MCYVVEVDIWNGILYNKSHNEFYFRKETRCGMMLSQERQNKIISILEKEHVIKITDIVKKFHVSHETVRRDLETLQEQGMVKRVYGGAILTADTPVSLASPRSRSHGYVERKAIGKMAAELVHEGDTVLLAMGSTILEVAKNIRHIKDVTVLTNSISVLNELVDSDVTLYLLGGHVSSSEHHMDGQLALQTLQNFNVDIAFVGAGGITLEMGVSDYSYEVSQMIQTMLTRAKCSVLVAQSDKFGKNCFSVTCPLSAIHIVVSDKNLPESYIRVMREMGIQLFLADGESIERSTEPDAEKKK